MLARFCWQDFVGKSLLARFCRQDFAGKILLARFCWQAFVGKLSLASHCLQACGKLLTSFWQAFGKHGQAVGRVSRLTSYYLGTLFDNLLVNRLRVGISTALDLAGSSPVDMLTRAVAAA